MQADATENIVTFTAHYILKNEWKIVTIVFFLMYWALVCAFISHNAKPCMATTLLIMFFFIVMFAYFKLL